MIYVWAKNSGYFWMVHESPKRIWLWRLQKNFIIRQSMSGAPSKRPQQPCYSVALNVFHRRWGERLLFSLDAKHISATLVCEHDSFAHQRVHLGHMSAWLHLRRKQNVSFGLFLVSSPGARELPCAALGNPCPQAFFFRCGNLTSGKNLQTAFTQSSKCQLTKYFL